MMNGTAQHNVVSLVRSTSKVKFDRVKLTPEYAEKLIGANSKNRNVSWKYVEQIARDIVAGRWQFDGSAIRVSKTGRLLDGQHRCHAVVSAKRAIDVLLITGLDESVMTTIDGGRTRSHGDRLSIEGETHANRKAAAATMILCLERGEIIGHLRLSFAEVRDALDRHKTAIEWACASIPPKIEPGIPCGGAYIYGPFAFFYPINPTRAQALAEKFVTGEGLTSQDPMKALRNVVANIMTDKRETRQATIARVLKCLEAGFTNSKLVVARVDDKVVERALRLRSEMVK